MNFTRRARTSHFAMAIALTLGGAVIATAAAEPAFAQDKKEKKGKKGKAAGNYSPEFLAAYQPLNTAAQAATDIPALKAAVPGLEPLIVSEDEKMAGGGLIFTIGQKASDELLQLKGIGLMLASGKVAPENLGPYNYQAGSLAYRNNKFDEARKFVQAAIDAGYTQNSPQVLIAESYFKENRAAEGLAYLTGAIDARKTAGQPVDESWIKRGLSVAYNAKLQKEAMQYANLYVSNYPSETSWGDAVAILLNSGGYQNPEILDLLRLARRTGGLRSDRLYLEYLDAADYRRLPAEVVSIIDEGYASGKLPKTNQMVIDTRKQAAARAATDKADFAATAKAANAANAPLRSILAAGDVSLSMGDAVQAEAFYTKALPQAGAETATVLTRLGIAQLDQGKYAEAKATFNKVQGARMAIASLWSTYATQKAGAPK